MANPVFEIHGFERTGHQATVRYTPSGADTNLMYLRLADVLHMTWNHSTGDQMIPDGEIFSGGFLFAYYYTTDNRDFVIRGDYVSAIYDEFGQRQDVTRLSADELKQVAITSLGETEIEATERAREERI